MLTTAFWWLIMPSHSYSSAFLVNAPPKGTAKSEQSRDRDTVIATDIRTRITCPVGLRQTLGLSCLILFLFCTSDQKSAQAQSATPLPQAIQLNQRGEALLTKKAYAAAAAEFRKALAIQPDYEDAVHNLGKALQAQGNSEDAVADFQKAIKLAPDDVVAHNDLGHALYHEGKYEDSLASYRKAIAIHDNYPEAYNGMGAAFLKMGNTDQAIAAFEKAAILDPNNADALNNAGAALVGQQRGEEAIPYLEKALHLKPDAPDTLENYGHALQQAGRTEDAITVYQRVVKHHPKDAASWAHLGHFQYAAQHYGESEASLKHSLRLNSHQPDVLLTLGAAYQAQGKTREAVQAYEKGLGLKPDDADGLYNLGHSYQSGLQAARPSQFSCHDLGNPRDYFPVVPSKTFHLMSGLLRWGAACLLMMI
jgi:tetratricopeptide (TPR) repeat protein